MATTGSIGISAGRSSSGCNRIERSELSNMRIFGSLRRPMGGFMVDPGEQQAETARAIEERLSYHIDRKLNVEFARLTRKMERLMAPIQARLQEILARVAEQSTKIDSIDTLMDGMRAQIATLLENAGADETTRMLADQIFQQAKDNSDKIDAAITENTTGGGGGQIPGPTPTPAPTPVEPAPVEPSPVPSDEPKTM